MARRYSNGGYPNFVEAAGGALGAGGLSAVGGGAFLPAAVGSLAGSYVGPALFPRSRRASQWGNVIGAAALPLVAGAGLGGAALAGLGALGGRALATNVFPGHNHPHRRVYYDYQCSSCGHHGTAATASPAAVEPIMMNHVRAVRRPSIPRNYN